MSTTALAWSFGVSALLCGVGLRKKWLSVDGAATAFVVGFVHTLAGNAFVFSLGAFFVSSSLLTKYKGQRKQQIEKDFKKGSQRNWKQVLANAGTSTLLCIAWLYRVGTSNAGIDFLADDISSFILAAFIGHFACTNGDTWASELGVLSEGDPYLITTWRKVKKGTNGGVSLLGTVASAMGGFGIGITAFASFYIFSQPKFDMNHYPVILLGLFGGLFGSFVDSVLGATLQFSGWDNEIKKVVEEPDKDVQHIAGLNILDNHQVNFISALITAGVTAWLAPHLYAVLPSL